MLGFSIGSLMINIESNSYNRTNVTATPRLLERENNMKLPEDGQRFQEGEGCSEYARRHT